MTRKINFSKVEEELAKAVNQMNIQHLLELATLANAVRKQEGEESKASEVEERVKKEVFAVLRKEAEQMKKRDEEFFHTIKVDESAYLDLLNNPDQITEEDWQKIQQIRERITEYAQAIKQSLPPGEEDEEIIARERKKHINKRFHVRDDWLPLK